MTIGVVPGPCPTSPITGIPICPPPNEVVCIKTKKVFQECRHTWVPNSITFTIPASAGTVVATGVTCGPVFLEPSFICENQLIPCTTSPPGEVLIPPVCPPVCFPCTTGCPPGVTPDNSATAAGLNLCADTEFPIPTCPPIFFPGEVVRCCVDCVRHEVVAIDDHFDIIYTMVLTNGQIFRNRQTICIPTTPVDFRRFFLSRAGEPGLKCQIEVFAECTQCFITANPTNGSVASIDCCFTFTLIGKLYSEVELMIPAYGYCPLPPECFPPLAVCPTIIPTGIPYPPEGGIIPPPPTTIGPTVPPTAPPTTPPPTIPPTTCPPTTCTAMCRPATFPGDVDFNAD